MKVTMSLNEIKAFNPCKNGWKTLLTALNKTEADDEPIDLAFIVQSNGIVDAIWCMRVNWFEHKALYMQFVNNCAARAKEYAVRAKADTAAYAADTAAHATATYAAYAAATAATAAATATDTATYAAADTATYATAAAATAAYAADTAIAEAATSERIKQTQDLLNLLS